MLCSSWKGRKKEKERETTKLRTIVSNTPQRTQAIESRKARRHGMGCFALPFPGQSPRTETQFVFCFPGLIPLETPSHRFYAARKCNAFHKFLEGKLGLQRGNFISAGALCSLRQSGGRVGRIGPRRGGADVCLQSRKTK